MNTQEPNAPETPSTTSGSPGDLIRTSLRALVEPGDLVEVRILKTPKGTVSGYYNDLDALARDAARWNRRAEGIYFTPNPVDPVLLARSPNRLTTHARSTTTDSDILRRRWFLIDFDPIRPSGISSTDAEHEAALAKAHEVRDSLRRSGWPDPILADSGNGAHLLYRANLANDAHATTLLKRCLEGLAFHFTDDRVAIDLTTYNPARIWKLYGTVAAKGVASSERPHRLSSLVEVPESVEPVPPEPLQQLAHWAPAPPPRPPRGDASGPTASSFDLGAWISAHAERLSISTSGPWKDGYKWVLQTCPWNAEHTDRSAYIVQFADGGIAAGCHHNTCADKDWRALRALIEPDAQDPLEEEARTQAQLLIHLAAGVELFHSPDGETAYGTAPVGDHFETWRLSSKAFRRWWSREFFRHVGKPPNSQALRDALQLLEARAHFEGPAIEVRVRVAAGADGTIYLDLANARREVVEITTTGWRVVIDPPVKFLRPRGLLALPTPVGGGNLLELKPFLNLPGDDDWTLAVGWLIGTLRPAGPYALLILNGEQGSAKSTMAAALRRLVDPNKASLRAEPRDVRDLVIAASNAWVLVYDNLSGLSPWLSDALCRLATGGGFGTRELYTDGEEMLFHAQRPIVLNGIEGLATRGDLADRAVTLDLPPIADSVRRIESAYWLEFEAAHPRILGALLDIISAVLGRLPEVSVPELPRMADFAHWVTAAEPALGWGAGTFLAAYARNRRAATTLVLESTPIAVEVLKFLSRHPGSWEGTATDLLGFLNAQVDERTQRQRSWPHNAAWLGNALRRVAPALRAHGVEVTFGREGGSGRRLIRLQRLPTGATSVSSDPSEQPRGDHHDDGTGSRF